MSIWITIRSKGMSTLPPFHNYSFGWELELAEAKEHFEEACSGESWDEWVKPVSVDDEGLEKLNGSHILFGQVESMEQSDLFPHRAFLYANNRMTYELKHVDEE